jgi:hypothetical protein
MPGHSACPADPRMPSPGSPGTRHTTGADDDVLAAVLIRMWSLASGRILRSNVRPDQLTEEELIRFWADDMVSPSGRHAARRAIPAQEAE